jgi:hypothetical protein
VELDSVGYARKEDKNCEIKKGGGGGEQHFTITAKMLQMFIFYNNDTSNGQNTTSEPKFEASNNKSCTSMCASVHDVNTNVATDPEASYYPRPVVHSSRQRAATVENTRLRSFPYCYSLSSSRWRNGSSTGRHSLYFFKGVPQV